MRRATRHEYELLEKIIAKLFDGSGSQEQYLLCVSSIISQCMFLHCNRPGDTGAFESGRIEALTEHIARFSLAGISEMKNMTKRNRT